jgi:hypothetical protein
MPREDLLDTRVDLIVGVLLDIGRNGLVVGDLFRPNRGSVRWRRAPGPARILPVRGKFLEPDDRVVPLDLADSAEGTE